MVKDQRRTNVCSGEPMQELKAELTDAAVEKHVHIIYTMKAVMFMSWSETKHPMLEEHFIDGLRAAKPGNIQKTTS